MGNFLHSPKTEKQTEVGEGNGLKYGISCMQGWRASMEDAHTAVSSIPGWTTSSFYAVYDGHGGSLAAEQSAAGLLKLLLETPHFRSSTSLNPPTIIGDMMKLAFLTMDDELRQLPVMGRGDDRSGCTAIGAFVTPTHIIVANAGDSRGVLGKNNGTVPLSFDHKPNDAREKERIEKAGGTVQNKRVNGDLAVSRALGDFVYKNRSDLPATAQQVSAEPDIVIQERDGTEEFIILACDGIWDVVDNEQACRVIRELLTLGETNLGLIAEELIDRCLDFGSRDNMSAVIIAMPGIQYGSGAGVAGLRAERARRKAEEEKAQGLSSSSGMGMEEDHDEDATTTTTNIRSLSQDQRRQLEQNEQILRMLAAQRPMMAASGAAATAAAVAANTDTTATIVLDNVDQPSSSSQLQQEEEEE